MREDAPAEERRKDILLVAIAIQLSIVGQVPPDDSLFVLLFIGILITGVVIIKELRRRYGEYAHR